MLGMCRREAARRKADTALRHVAVWLRMGRPSVEIAPGVTAGDAAGDDAGGLGGLVAGFLALSVSARTG